jgi:hypothetical protein
MTHDRNNSAASGSNRSSAVALVSLWRDIRFLNAILLIAIFGFFISYLIMNDQTAEKGFVARSLETHISDLQQTSQKLNLSVVSDESMDALQGKTASLGLVPVTTIDYVSAGSDGMAIR